MLDGLRDLLLGCEDVVQLDLGHRRAHHVKHIRLDLLLGVGEAVVRVLDRLLVFVDLVLHGHTDQHEDVILGLGLAGDLHLLEPHRHRGGGELTEARNHNVQAWLRNLGELSKLLDKRDRPRVHSHARDESTRHSAEVRV